MAQRRRKCKLVNTAFKDTVDLRDYEQIIIEAIESTVPGKHPKVYKTYYSIDEPTQSESVAIGRSLAKIPELNAFGKTVTTFRLFDGKTYESEESNVPVNTKKSKPKGGRMQ